MPFGSASTTLYLLCPTGHARLYEKVAFKSTSAEPLPRWAIGTGQSSCLQFRSGTIARRGRGGIMPFTIFNIRCVRQDMWVI